jgi:hypothetical protein
VELIEGKLKELLAEKPEGSASKKKTRAPTRRTKKK